MAGRIVRVEEEETTAFGGRVEEALVTGALETRVVSPEVDLAREEEDEEEVVAIPRLVRPRTGRWRERYE